MYRGSLLSALFHAAVILVVIFGLPHFARDLPMMDLPVPVDVVTVADITNAPPPKPEAETPEPPKPEPPKAVPPSPPEPEVKAPEPKPEPKPEPPKALAEAPPPTPKPKTKPEPPLKDIKPEKKPPPPDDMESVLKSVDKLKQQAEKTPVETAEALKERDRPRDFNPAVPVSISQIDAIRRHFEKCWNIPAGAREAENLAVDIRVTLAPDATVATAAFVASELPRIETDPFYRAAAESALRAVRAPLCSSLQDVGLSPDQYDQWKDMVITFNPKQMIGA